MAERCLLHKSKLELFAKWLAANGYDIQPTKGIYESLRAKKEKDTVIIFAQDGAKEHLTVQQKDYRLVRQFIRESREDSDVVSVVRCRDCKHKGNTIKANGWDIMRCNYHETGTFGENDFCSYGERKEQ